VGCVPIMPVDRLVFRAGTQRLAAVQPPGVRLRQYRPSSDGAAIAALLEACRTSTEPTLTTDGMLGELTSRPGRLVTAWLAMNGETPVGLVAAVTAGLGPERRHSIAWLVVAERARRQGVGRVLTAAAVDAALAAGAREVWVETRTDWTPAVAFWAAVGFRPVA
jgi:ribosomal protein S18 acetylase RimI-like enzyme